MPKPWPVTLDEAVGVVIASLSDNDRAQIAAMAKSELIGLHFGLGMWIRNNLSLWQEDSALLQAIRQRKPGIHPDDASMILIEETWRRLREMAPTVH